MSDLTNLEKRQFERLFQMGGGYVLDFSNRTFAEFVSDSVARDIYDARYAYGTARKLICCADSGRRRRTAPSPSC